MGTPLLVPQRTTFRAFAETAVPEMAELDETGWAQVEQTIERALAARPPKMRRQLGLLLRAIALLPVTRHGRTFSRLTPAHRASFLEKLQHAPVKLLRRGVWGLRTLVLMGYYTRPETMAAVGYRADARGWQARRGHAADGQARDAHAADGYAPGGHPGGMDAP